MRDLTALEILDHIDPTQLDYQDWTFVGMALHHAGNTASDWDNWSQRDAARYHAGECFTKWKSFRGSSSPITVGSLVQMARDQGWEPETDVGWELAWDACIGPKEEYRVIDKNWLEGKEVQEPVDWNPVEQLVKYLETLFESAENVGYVTESWEKEGKHMPTKGCWDRTAGELIQQLNKCKGDIGSVLGDYKPEVGAWIRFNPLDGTGVKNENVTEFRYALVESDHMSIDEQNAIIRELELPVACLVHSGNESLHAIVRIDAPSYEEYRKRVDYLYNICKKNGFIIDRQNRNPSRLSRMPGIMRNGHKQFLIDTNIGKESWKEWQEWIEGVNDDLPEPETLAGVWDNLPDLAPSLIEGVLRIGHKMLLAGPAKAGKSFSLIQLCISIAEGKPWLGWDCAQGRVLYVNLELDRASCLHRFHDVYDALGWEAKNLGNIDIWNLRGKSVPMDKLAPKLIRRAQKKGYVGIIIDPIYKVITGDENSADQMANFCNQFDKVAAELGASVIYCHHHSKGYQGQKRAMDRASGSGVFARDPDVLLDIIELDLPSGIRDTEESKAVARVCRQWLDLYCPGWMEDVGQSELDNEFSMLANAQRNLGKRYNNMLDDVFAARQWAQRRTAWRIDGTLREFPNFPAVDMWFNYPTHSIDTDGVLKNVLAEAEKTGYIKANEKRHEESTRMRDSIPTAYDALKLTESEISVKMLAEYMDVTTRTIRRKVDDLDGFEIKNNLVIKV